MNLVEAIAKVWPFRRRAEGPCRVCGGKGWCPVGFMHMELSADLHSGSPTRESVLRWPCPRCTKDTGRFEK